jgi:hypothetical protein
VYTNTHTRTYWYTTQIQSNLPMWSPLLSSHLYWKVTILLPCHRKFHIPLLSSHLYWKVTILLPCHRKYSQTCIKRSWPLGQKKTWPYKRFNSYKVFYDRAIKWWPFNTGDCLIEVYEVFYDRAIKWWPFNTGDCLIEVYEIFYDRAIKWWPFNTSCKAMFSFVPKVMTS